jgi:tRNA (cmo5U34)-methyltransferase
LAQYRWNATEAAIGYDQAAGEIHPHYVAIQDAIVQQLEALAIRDGLIVDLGGGSGRLAEKIAQRFPDCQVVVVDQSEPFLALASKRLDAFSDRGRCVLSQLQDGWERELDSPPAALVSMSAIHHLVPAEKQSLYRRCFEVLRPGGVLLNGDEVRPAGDAEFRRLLDAWWAHMQQVMAEGQLSAEMEAVLQRWKERNLDRFDAPRVSGDDNQETIDAQLGYLRGAGFVDTGAPWQRELWAILRGVKPNST